MASQATVISSHKPKAEVSTGDSCCKKKIAEFLKDVGLPLGLLQLAEVEEFGYNKEAGFFWIIQKKKTEHTFKKIKETVSYATEMTGFADTRKLKGLVGVKVKELFIWLNVNEVYIADPASEKITFKTGTGLADSFPVSAFELEG